MIAINDSLSLIAILRIFQLLDPDNSIENFTTQIEILTVNEKYGATFDHKWIFEIFHGDYVNGIRQTNKDWSGKSEVTTIGDCVDGEKEIIELTNGEHVIKIEFSGLDLD